MLKDSESAELKSPVNKKRKLVQFFVLFVLVFGPACFLILISLNKCEHKFEQLPTYGKLPDFEFSTSSGKKINSGTQEGKITIYSTIQIGCPEDCAIDLLKFNLMLYQHYRKYQKKMGHIKFISIATDNEGNPVDNIEELEFMLSDIVEDYDSSIWTIVTGDPKQIYNIENNDINLLEIRDDSSYALKPYLEMLLIVDKLNNVRLARRGNKEGYIRDFKEHVALLQKQYDKEAYNERNHNTK